LALGRPRVAVRARRRATTGRSQERPDANRSFERAPHAIFERNTLRTDGEPRPRFELGFQGPQLELLPAERELFDLALRLGELRPQRAELALVLLLNGVDDRIGE